jgi:hypothetical protein
LYLLAPPTTSSKRPRGPTPVACIVKPPNVMQIRQPGQPTGLTQLPDCSSSLALDATSGLEFKRARASDPGSASGSSLESCTPKGLRKAFPLSVTALAMVAAAPSCWNLAKRPAQRRDRNPWASPRKTSPPLGPFRVLAMLWTYARQAPPPPYRNRCATPREPTCHFCFRSRGLTHLVFVGPSAFALGGPLDLARYNLEAPLLHSMQMQEKGCGCRCDAVRHSLDTLQADFPLPKSVQRLDSSGVESHFLSHHA